MRTAAWILATLAITGTLGFEAYDCDAPDLRHRVISLIGPAACPEPEETYRPVITRRAQAIQSSTRYPVKTYTCEGYVTKVVRRCGYDGINYAAATPVFKARVHFTTDSCREAIATGTMTYENTELPVKIGAETTKAWFTHGSGLVAGSDGQPDGNCLTEDFWSGGLFFRKSYEEARISVTIKVVRGIVDLATQTLETNDGRRLDYEDGGNDSRRYPATMVWETEAPDCEDRVSQIFTGDVEVYEKKSGLPMDGALVLGRNPNTEQFMGLVLRGKARLCGEECYATQAEGLMICFLRELEEPIKTKFNPTLDQNRLAIQTTNSYQVINSELSQEARLLTLNKEICELDRKILSVQLQAVAVGNDYSLRDVFGPGHRITREGAAAYVTRCKAVEVTKAPYANCTREIPVRVPGSDEIMFADAVSFILTPFGSTVPCSSIQPTRYYIGREWWCATPDLARCEKAEELQSSLPRAVTEGPQLEGLTQNIFTKEQEEAHREHVWASHAEKALRAVDATRAVTRRRGQTLGPTLSDLDLDASADHGLSRVVPGYSWLKGKVLQVVTAVLLIILAITLCGCAIRCRELHQAAGCGLHLAHGLCDALMARKTHRDGRRRDFHDAARAEEGIVAERALEMGKLAADVAFPRKEPAASAPNSQPSGPSLQERAGAAASRVAASMGPVILLGGSTPAAAGASSTPRAEGPGVPGGGFPLRP